MLIYSQMYYTNKLITLNQQNTLLLEVEKDLLRLRRTEKDFLLQKDAFLGEQFKQRGLQFEEELNQLIKVVEFHQLDPELAQNIGSAFDQYRNTFFSLYDKQLQMGLNENSGEHGRFRDRIHLLEDELNALGWPELQVMLLQLRRHEKDFMQRRRLQYVELEEAQFQELKKTIENQTDTESHRLLSLLDGYHSSFQQLVVLFKEIGLDSQNGLLGELSQQSDALEAQLTHIEEVLVPTIYQQEITVRKHGIVIVTVTALALLILLIRSFMTFQKAFTDFVLFFYRCKRIRQPLDARKMSFTEFKSLADAANEMIESQRQTELKLKNMEAQLDKLRGTPIIGDSPAAE
jgi:methyl-accepting chemotaxis protein